MAEPKYLALKENIINGRSASRFREQKFDFILGQIDVDLMSRCSLSAVMDWMNEHNFNGTGMHNQQVWLSVS